jgi:hypothetical protein
MHTLHARSHAAFARLELVTVIVLTCLCFALLSVAGERARRETRTAGSIANLQKYATAITSFAADNEDRIISFSWRGGVSHTDRTGYVFPTAVFDSEAAGHQAVAIIRWYADRRDITAITGWLPHILYSHLPLIEYLEHPLPAEFTVSPHDLNRLAWQRAVRNMAPGEAGAAYFNLPNRPAGSGNNEKRWPYSSSYTFVPASFSPDARQLIPGGGVIPTISQEPLGHRYYQIGTPATPLGRRRVSEIFHPDKKVIIYEGQPAEGGGALPSFYAYGRTKAPLLFGDGSVASRTMSRANPGFLPNNPFNSSPTRINYTPELSWEPPTLSGAASELVNGTVQWTRAGLRGRDFDGPEVPWVD